MGDDPPHGLGAGGVSVSRGPLDHGKETIPAPGQKLGVIPFWVSDVGGGAGESGGVRPKNSEYYCEVYCNTEDSGPLWGGDVEAGDSGI